MHIQLNERQIAALDSLLGIGGVITADQIESVEKVSEYEIKIIKKPCGQAQFSFRVTFSIPVHIALECL